ncbi:MAG TPA: hypothetical protein PLU82_01475 [Oscillospiraceae bacterium]|nr:hypothetical protein [Oscillospiraceae bacterium]
MEARLPFLYGGLFSKAGCRRWVSSPNGIFLWAAARRMIAGQQGILGFRTKLDGSLKDIKMLWKRGKNR